MGMDSGMMEEGFEGRMMVTDGKSSSDGVEEG